MPGLTKRAQHSNVCAKGNCWLWPYCFKTFSFSKEERTNKHFSHCRLNPLSFNRKNKAATSVLELTVPSHADGQRQRSNSTAQRAELKMGLKVVVGDEWPLVFTNSIEGQTARSVLSECHTIRMAIGRSPQGVKTQVDVGKWSYKKTRKTEYHSLTKKPKVFVVRRHFPSILSMFWFHPYVAMPRDVHKGRILLEGQDHAEEVPVGPPPSPDDDDSDCSSDGLMEDETISFRRGQHPQQVRTTECKSSSAPKWVQRGPLLSSLRGRETRHN